MGPTPKGATGSGQPSSRSSVTAAVIARDEAANVEACLRSLAWADERLVVLDAATVDRTRELAQAVGARVEIHPFVSFPAQRDAALALATRDWVLFVDADERVSEALANEVRERVAEPGRIAGFWVPRENVIMGRLVRGAGWWPDYQLRLLLRHAARFDPHRVVHELPILEGEEGHLAHPLLHLSYRTWPEFIEKQARYAPLEAQRWVRTFGRPRRRALVGQPAREFWRRYVVLRGYRDGAVGLGLSLILAWYQGVAVARARVIGRALPSG